jgi:hypothetical protein
VAPLVLALSFCAFANQSGGRPVRINIPADR